MTSVRLGLDIGTTAIKAAAFDPDGRLLALSQVAAQMLPAPAGHSEQDPDQVWAHVCQVLQELVGKLGSLNVVSLGICAQGDGLWLIDEGGAALGPAMLWNDTRAAQDVVALSDAGRSAAVARACHTSLWPGTSAALWRWLTDHAPERQKCAAHAVTCGDWVGLKLTGAVAIDFSNATIPFLDINTRQFSDCALAATGCEDLKSRLPVPRRADSLLGRITSDAAKATGLSEGLPVSVPTMDLSAMIVGMGMDQPGDTMMIMGTTAVVNILTDTVTPTDTPVGASALHPVADTIIRVLAPTTGAAAFDWFADLHPQTLGGADAGEIAAKLNALIKAVPPGANGVTFLPYLNGERAPFVAPSITASFHGLTGQSTKADMGRAVMEGAAMSLRHCFEMEGGLPTRPVQLTGGGSKNAAWCQIIADIVGAPVIVSEASDQGLWGAAVLGAAAAGLGEAMALAKRSETSRRYDPDPDKTQDYTRVFARYRQLSDAMRALSDTSNGGST